MAGQSIGRFILCGISAVLICAPLIVFAQDGAQDAERACTAGDYSCPWPQQKNGTQCMQGKPCIEVVAESYDVIPGTCVAQTTCHATSAEGTSGTQEALKKPDLNDQSILKPPPAPGSASHDLLTPEQRADLEKQLQQSFNPYEQTGEQVTDEVKAAAQRSQSAADRLSDLFNPTKMADTPNFFGNVQDAVKDAWSSLTSPTPFAQQAVQLEGGRVDGIGESAVPTSVERGVEPLPSDIGGTTFQQPFGDIGERERAEQAGTFGAGGLSTGEASCDGLLCRAAQWAQGKVSSVWEAFTKEFIGINSADAKPGDSVALTQEQAIRVDARGRINTADYYNTARDKFADSDLIGRANEIDMPQSVRDKLFPQGGTADEWARFATQLCQQESGCRVASVNQDGSLKRFATTISGETSYGPLQFNKGEYGLKSWADVNNPARTIDALVSIAEADKLQAYFGSVQRPNEVLQHSSWFTANVAPNIGSASAYSEPIADIGAGAGRSPVAEMSVVGGDSRLTVPYSNTGLYENSAVANYYSSLGSNSIIEPRTSLSGTMFGYDSSYDFSPRAPLPSELSIGESTGFENTPLPPSPYTVSPLSEVTRGAALPEITGFEQFQPVEPVTQSGEALTQEIESQVMQGNRAMEQAILQDRLVQADNETTAWNTALAEAERSVPSPVPSPVDLSDISRSEDVNVEKMIPTPETYEQTGRNVTRDVFSASEADQPGFFERLKMGASDTWNRITDWWNSAPSTQEGASADSTGAPTVETPASAESGDSAVSPQSQLVPSIDTRNVSDRILTADAVPVIPVEQGLDLTEPYPAGTVERGVELPPAEYAQDARAAGVSAERGLENGSLNSRFEGSVMSGPEAERTQGDGALDERFSARAAWERVQSQVSGAWEGAKEGVQDFFADMNNRLYDFALEREIPIPRVFEQSGEEITTQIQAENTRSQFDPASTAQDFGTPEMTARDFDPVSSSEPAAAKPETPPVTEAPANPPARNETIPVPKPRPAEAPPRTQTPPAAGPAAPAAPAAPSPAPSNGIFGQGGFGGAFGSLGQMLGSFMSKLFGGGSGSGSGSGTSGSGSNTGQGTNTNTSTQTQPKPVVVLFPLPPTVVPGGVSKLTWASVGTKECTLKGADGTILKMGGPDGTATTSALTITTAFSVLCSSSSGQTARSTVEVRVQ